MREDDHRDRHACSGEVARRDHPDRRPQERDAARSRQGPRGSASGLPGSRSSWKRVRIRSNEVGREEVRDRRRRGTAGRARGRRARRRPAGRRAAPPTCAPSPRSTASASCGCGTTALNAPLVAGAEERSRRSCRRTRRAGSARTSRDARARRRRARRAQRAGGVGRRSSAFGGRSGRPRRRRRGEEDERRELDGADVAGLRRRAGEREREQRIRDRGHRRPEGRERAARPAAAGSRGSAGAE